MTRTGRLRYGNWRSRRRDRGAVPSQDDRPVRSWFPRESRRMYDQAVDRRRNSSRRDRRGRGQSGRWTAVRVADESTGVFGAVVVLFPRLYREFAAGLLYEDPDARVERAVHRRRPDRRRDLRSDGDQGVREASRRLTTSPREEHENCDEDEHRLQPGVDEDDLGTELGPPDAVLEGDRALDRADGQRKEAADE